MDRQNANKKDEKCETGNDREAKTGWVKDSRREKGRAKMRKKGGYSDL